jgi:hypothetical protein
MAFKRRGEKEPLPRMMFREPKAISGAQVITNFAAAIAGALAAIGAGPAFLAGQVGTMLSFVVGIILVIGGVVGGITVLFGNWWLERVALMVTGLGWALLLPAAISFAMSGRGGGGIWLVVALITAALGDIVKRYLRIQWAYLDPRR